MRRILTLPVIASLLLALAQAPLLHTHGHDPAHDHAGGLSHVHFAPPHHDHEGDHLADQELPAFELPDTAADVLLLDWLAGDGATRLKPFLAAPSIRVTPSLVAQAIASEPPAPHYHDPPWRLSLHPRAPPV